MRMYGRTVRDRGGRPSLSAFQFQHLASACSYDQFIRTLCS